MTMAVANGVQAALDRRAAGKVQRAIARHQREARQQALTRMTPEQRQARIRQSFSRLAQLGIPVIDMRGQRSEEPD